jgi:hypothetical protein
MTIASLVLGIVGTATGLGALAWQVITWRRSGPIVRVAGNCSTGLAGKTGVVDITAWNEGRGPVSVIVCGLQWPDGSMVVTPQPLQGSDVLPFQLEPGSIGQWQIPVPASLDTIPLRLRAYVKLVNGKIVSDTHPGIRYG